MPKNINLPRLLKAILISFSFIYLSNMLLEESGFLLNLNFFISLLIYTILSFVALQGYEFNKLIGMILFFSISLLSPSLYPEFKGELYPITYVLFSLFLTYLLGINMYKKWKSGL